MPSSINKLDRAPATQRSSIASHKSTTRRSHNIHIHSHSQHNAPLVRPGWLSLARVTCMYLPTGSTRRLEPASHSCIDDIGTFTPLGLRCMHGDVWCTSYASAHVKYTPETPAAGDATAIPPHASSRSKLPWHVFLTQLPSKPSFLCCCVGSMQWTRGPLRSIKPLTHSPNQ